MPEPAESALPTDRVGRVAIAMFTLYVRSCEHFDDRFPSRTKVAREWRSQSAFLREGWLAEARYVLRAADAVVDPQPKED